MNRGRTRAEANKILYVKNLPYKIGSEELYDIFGKYGAIRQIRLGNSTTTRGSAFVVYHEVQDAKKAVDHLSGFSVGGRYLVCVFYSSAKMHEKQEGAKAESGTKKE